jgi:hypothetical protein
MDSMISPRSIRSWIASLAFLALAAVPAFAQFGLEPLPVQNDPAWPEVYVPSPPTHDEDRALALAWMEKRLASSFRRYYDGWNTRREAHTICDAIRYRRREAGAQALLAVLEKDAEGAGAFEEFLRLQVVAFRAAQDADDEATVVESLYDFFVSPGEGTEFGYGPQSYQFSVLDRTIERNKYAKYFVDDILRRIFPELERAPFHPSRT